MMLIPLFFFFFFYYYYVYMRGEKEWWGREKRGWMDGRDIDDNSGESYFQCSVFLLPSFLFVVFVLFEFFIKQKKMGFTAIFNIFQEK